MRSSIKSGVKWWGDKFNNGVPKNHISHFAPTIHQYNYFYTIHSSLKYWYDAVMYD